MAVLALFILISPLFVTSVNLPPILDSNMVLQRSPQRARLWGWGVSGESVSITLDTATTPQWKTTVQSNGNWSVDLDPQPATPPGQSHTITINATSGNRFLKNILFGDVWLCSGQSNMQFSVNTVFNASDEIADSINYPQMRYFTQTLTASETPLNNLTSKTGYNWGVSGPSTMVAVGGANMSWPSAVCYFFSRNIYQYFNGTIPIGFVDSDWGGTVIEAWSSPDALNHCRTGLTPINPNIYASTLKTNNRDDVKTEAVNQNDPTVLWNGMISPLLPMRFMGAVWYQGEQNSANASGYSCMFPAMITDWRSKFNLELPFFFAQLAGYPDSGVYAYIRQAQLSALSLSKVGYATAIDLGDPTSPYGSIHSRRKQEVGRRLALSALSIAYGLNVQYGGPKLANISITQPTTGNSIGTVLLKFTNANNLHVYGTGGCTDCCNISPFIFELADGSLHRASYTLDLTNSLVTATLATSFEIRYVYYDFEDLPQCSLYNGQGGPDNHTGIAATPFEYIPNPKSYQLVFRQTIPFLYTKNQWSLNPTEPDNDNYSILDQLNKFQTTSKTLEFKLRWPQNTSQNIWLQTSNPVTSKTVTGYKAIHISHTDHNWIGLKLNNFNYSLLDGSDSTNASLWYYAIGSFRPFQSGNVSGIPSWSAPKRQVELYVQQDSNSSWVLVFRQNYPYFYAQDQWSRNPENPNSEVYSILDKLENYRSKSGTFTFKLYWPEDDENIWKQDNNPVTSTNGVVTNLQPVSISHTQENFGGLEYNNGTQSLLDGSIGSTYWYYAIGSTSLWNGGIPSWGSTAAQQAELYVRTE